MTAAAVIRVWGADHLQALVRRWKLELSKSQPRVYVEGRLTGSDVAMAGLYTGLADLAVLGRECTAVDHVHLPVHGSDWIVLHRASLASTIWSGALLGTGLSIWRRIGRSYPSTP